MARRYVPKRGEIVWLNFDPQAGHEQAGRWPALLLSPQSYNELTGLLLCCPITKQVKGYPFKVPLPKGLGVSGVVLADHLRSVDWRARDARKIAVGPAILVEATLLKTLALLDIDDAG